MRYIKKFESDVTPHRNLFLDDSKSQGETGKTNAFYIMSKLMNGYAIEVPGSKIEKLVEVLSKYSDEFDIPNYKNMGNTKYFLMIGDKLIHTDIPSFGLYDLAIFRPNF